MTQALAAPRTALLAVTLMAAGLWLGSTGPAGTAVFATAIVCLAAANGYSKAYSP